jgi:hypothetical protein
VWWSLKKSEKCGTAILPGIAEPGGDDDTIPKTKYRYDTQNKIVTRAFD